MSLTLERLRELLDYSPETGVFIWKKPTGRRVGVGSIAGGKGRYITVMIEGNRYRAHRLAWLYCYGSWPSKRLDHINRDGHDNRIANLREATQSENLCNRKARRDNTLGFKGVVRQGSRFAARIKKEAIRLSLGTFDTPEEAYSAYCDAARKLHGAFANIGD